MHFSKNRKEKKSKTHEVSINPSYKQSNRRSFKVPVRGSESVQQAIQWQRPCQHQSTQLLTTHGACREKKKIDIHLPPTCFSRRKTAFWQIYKMQLFPTIYSFIFQSGIKVLIAVGEKHNPPPGSGGWLMLQRNSLHVHYPASELAKTGSRASTPLSSDHLYLLCHGGRGGGVWSPGVLLTE